MRKSFCFFVFLIFLVQNPAFSAELDDFADIDRAWDAQQAITNQEYEEVIEALEEKKEEKEVKKRKKLFKKIGGGGTSLHKEMNPDKEIKEIKTFEEKEEGILLNVPVDIVLGSKVLERGYYKLIAERDENKNILIYFYQSQFLKGTLQAIETTDDYQKETIDFADLLPFNESFVKLIFGSLDFNAYAYVQYLEN